MNFKKDPKIKALIVLITVVLIVLMFPKGQSIESDVTVGSIWTQEDLIATTTFQVMKDEETYEKQKQDAAESVHKIFVRKEGASQSSIDSLKSFNKTLLNLINKDIKNDTTDFSNRVSFLDKQSYETLKSMKVVEAGVAKSYDKRLSNVFNVSELLLKNIYRKGVIDLPFDEIEKDSIAIREGKYERIVPKSRFYDPETASDYIAEYLNNRFSTYESVNESVKQLVSNFIKPNIIFDRRLTDRAVQNAVNKVSRTEGIVNENERIVAKHDKITDEIKRKIESYRRAKAEETSELEQVFQALGKFIHVIIIFALLIIYIRLFRHRIYFDNSKILLFAIVILFIGFLTFIFSEIEVSAPIELFILVPVASMLITIFFDSRLGFYTTIVVSLIAGGLRGNDYVFALTHMIAGALAAYTVRDIKNRSQIFRSFLFILAGYILSIVAFGLERFDTVDEMLVRSAFAASNALVSPVLTYGLIIFFEKIFKITTDLTLLELTDFNNAPLKELSKKAPGTFTHSMTIGSLVENAAEEIGANSILARVGAYYHDIGKTINPQGFVENQLSNQNIHEKIDPHKSVSIIINHVKKGIELAKSYKLPQEVIDFIPMHHGTMVISFFYEKAKEEFGEDNVNIDDFRYPGPKPNTKETALVMLADACESTVRSMQQPEVQKVENIINNLFKARIDDGQLDDAPLTLQDIKKIKESFLGILIGQYHKRVRYPKQDEMENTSEQNKAE
jgi:putative nucleotidyltransferase with HDIG domain